jgi:hypothetical protein
MQRCFALMCLEQGISTTLEQELQRRIAALYIAGEAQRASLAHDDSVHVCASVDQQLVVLALAFGIVFVCFDTFE